MTSFSAEQTQVLATAFAVEVDETRSHLTKAILRLERGREDHRPVLFAMLTRGLHTLKGSAASIGMSDVSAIAHLLEDAVAPTVAARTALSPEIATLLLSALDVMHESVSAHASGGATAIDVESWKRRARALESGPSPAVRPLPSSTDEQPARGAEPVEWRVNEADVSALASEAGRLNDLAGVLRERAEFAHAASEVYMHDATATQRLSELARVLVRDASGLDALAATIATRIATLSSVRVGLVVEPLRRLARDQAAASGKRVTLEIRGEDLVVARRTAGGLRGALLHLVSNAVVHGIEPAAVRVRNGKASDGRISVTLQRSTDELRVVVEDDGAGLDVERVRAVAVGSGLVSSDRASKLTETELFPLVLEPAFTTKQSVTLAAGRGVGLDAVSATVRELGGTISIESAVGKGARFVLQLPASS